VARLRARELPPPRLENLNPPARGYRYFQADEDEPSGHRRFDPERGLGDACNRWLLGESALLAYDDDHNIPIAFGSWAKEVCAPTKVDPARGYCYAVDLDGRDALLAFRGTRVFNYGDPPTKLLGVLEDLRVDASFPLYLEADGVGVHSGFRAQLLDLFAPGVEGSVRHWIEARPRRWWISGHSLGGALAVLASEVLHAMPGHSVGGVLTLGQPRVGNARHAQRLAGLHIPILRLVHGCDAIPAVPLESMKYVHVGEERQFAPERRANAATSVARSVLGLWSRLRYGVGALTPLPLRDHAPLTYATHCYNQFVDSQ
jgi:hypothetical protein